MRKRSIAVLVAVATVWGWAPAAQAEEKAEPGRVVVQHILISFKGKLPRKQIDRTKAEAEELADEILGRALAGEDFDELVKEYTNDSHPGIYTIANRGQPKPPGGMMRDNMVSRFGDVAFSLEVGGIGMADYSGSASPYGWHIIKRLE